MALQPMLFLRWLGLKEEEMVMLMGVVDRDAVLLVDAADR